MEDFVESNVSAIVGGTATGYVGKFNLSAYYSEDLGQYSIATTYYDGDSNAVPGNAETAICVVFYYANGFESAPTHYEAICFDTEQHLFDDQGSVEATEWKVLPAEEPAEEGKSGTTEITAVKEEPEFAYTIVIPTATTLNDEAHEDVQLGGNSGKASITVTTPSAKTNVYYTVNLTNATLTDGTNTITTTYAYAQGGDYAALTGDTKVTVYEGGTVKDSTVQVTADDTAWAAAPAGTYTASVVFNFATEEAEAEKIDWVITFDGADLGDVEVNMPYVFTAATAEGATAATPVTYTIEEGGSYYSIGDDMYGDPNKMNIYVLEECPYDQVTITVTYPEDDIHRETSKSAVFTYNIVG
ncbi:MAG: hypothetical protein Q3995_05950 [Eubacteriales bacterium]|nr:hypothetical protein [Eubacteriales bacterium]